MGKKLAAVIEHNKAIAREWWEIAKFLDQAADMECEDETPVRALVDKFRYRAEMCRDRADVLYPALKIEKSDLKVETP